MKWIEFFGMSGVGKTTLFKHVLACRTAEDVWITPDEAMELAVKRCAGHKPVASRLFPARLLLRRLTGGLSIRAQRSSDIARLKNEAFYSVGHRYDALAYILIRYFADHGEMSPLGRLRMMSWYMNERLKHFMALGYCKIQETILYEDGILHNNAGVRYISSYLKDIDPIYLRDCILYPSAAIICMNSPDFIYERAKQRLKEGRGTFIHRNMNDRELRDYIDRSSKEGGGMIRAMEAAGVPVLRINTSDDLLYNALTVNAFIRECMQSIGLSK